MLPGGHWTRPVLNDSAVLRERIYLWADEAQAATVKAWAC